MGVYDEVVACSAGHRSVAGDITLWWACEMRRRGETRLFPVTFADISRHLASAGRMVGVPRMTPYLLRHGGASDDGAVGVQLVDIQRRGRWGALSSARRYQKAGELHAAWAALAPRHVAFAEWAASNVFDVIRNTACCISLPGP